MTGANIRGNKSGGNSVAKQFLVVRMQDVLGGCRDFSKTVARILSVDIHRDR